MKLLCTQISIQIRTKLLHTYKLAYKCMHTKWHYLLLAFRTRRVMLTLTLAPGNIANISIGLNEPIVYLYLDTGR